ncbi:MAG: DUF5785 family protein [Halobacteriaceae archaeon]
MAEMEDPSGRDWPHDPDGEAGSEGGRKYGLAVIAKKVEDATFPVDRESFLDEYGDDPVRLNHEQVVSVADVFEYVDGEEFEDKVSFHGAVGDAMREGDFWEYTP